MENELSPNRRKANSLSARCIGDEPVWVIPKNKEEEKLQLIKFFNWYTYNCNKSHSKKFIIQYIKNTQVDSDILMRLNNLSEDYFPSTVGWIARILLHGAKGLSENSYKKLNDTIAYLMTIVNKSNIDQTKKVSIQEALNNQLDYYFGAIEEQIDLFILSNFSNDFNFDDWLKKSQIKPIYMNRIIERFTKQKKEIEESMNGFDLQLIEGYSHWTATEKTKLIQFYQNILNSSTSWLNSAKVIQVFNRKPRTTKIKPAHKLVEKVKYQKRNDEYDIVSTPPEKMIGANQIWIFNTKTRMLGVYTSSNDRGIFVKGTTIKNFNPEKSTEKILRKPKEMLEFIKKDGKVNLRKHFESINAKQNELNGRLNANTVIIRVFN